jgi:hypothetical protein
MLDNEGQQRSFDQFMNLFVLPEIERRKKDCLLRSNFVLKSAQVIFSGDGTRPVVRLNEETKIMAKVKPKSGIKINKGDILSWNQIEDIQMIRLPDEEEGKFAHISMIRVGGNWLFTFDFRYNKESARTCFETAKQFFDSAREAFERKNLAPFIDNLFSSIELLAKAELLLMPDPKFKQKATHKGIQLKYGKYVDIGNAKPEFKTTLNKLAGLRNSARYLQSGFNLSDKEGQGYLAIASDMISYVEGKLKKHT